MVPHLQRELRLVITTRRSITSCLSPQHAHVGFYPITESYVLVASILFSFFLIIHVFLSSFTHPKHDFPQHALKFGVNRVNAAEKPGQLSFADRVVVAFLQNLPHFPKRKPRLPPLDIKGVGFRCKFALQFFVPPAAG